MSTTTLLQQATEIGSPLYVPAVRKDLKQICSGERFPFLQSVILCLEDAIHKHDLPDALSNISALISSTDKLKCKIFVRVANPDVLSTVCSYEGAEQLCGFVLPKINATNFTEYTSAIPPQSRYALMPTLETRDVFSSDQMRRLRDTLITSHHDILCLRIGGNDLLNCLGVRRAANKTIYQTPLSATIYRLLAEYHPFGFLLSAPVYDNLTDALTLRAEAALDSENGLLCKAAVHPSQVKEIELQYRVTQTDVEIAERILEPDAPAVFGCQGQMCEPSTQSRWAQVIQARYQRYGQG